MTPREADRLAGHMAQARLARVARVLCAIAGLVGAFWHGLASILLGVAGVWFFGLARPTPDDTLDKATGRKRD